MSIQTGGSVTLVNNISSRARQAGTTGLDAINASLEARMPLLASKLGPLRFNAAARGVIEAPWWERVTDALCQGPFDQMAAVVPAIRLGRPKDIPRKLTC